MTVCSWNEWDPLREVIVGTVEGAADMGYEPALSCYGGDPQFRGGAVDPELVLQAARQMEGFAELLARHGITVRHPDPIDHSRPYKTPDWAIVSGRANSCPRDLVLVIGDEIIEAPMAQRGRFFEYRGYRTLIKEYFRQGARWTAAPKPLMSDELYHARTAPYDYIVDGPVLTEHEPAFDAACFVRMGRDIFWQPDLVSNDFGAAWLQRHLGPGFRIHRIGFREKTPTHIDTTLVPVRPGLVLTNPGRPWLDDSLALFTRNDWQVVPAPPSVRSGPTRPGGVSNWISLNILMLDERTAIVEQAEKPLMELLRSHGCEAIPCPFDQVFGFGGSFHCCTTDIRREGKLASYFPSLD